MWWKKVTANKEFGTLKNILKSEGKIKMIWVFSLLLDPFLKEPYLEQSY